MSDEPKTCVRCGKAYPPPGVHTCSGPKPLTPEEVEQLTPKVATQDSFASKLTGDSEPSLLARALATIRARERDNARLEKFVLESSHNVTDSFRKQIDLLKAEVGRLQTKWDKYSMSDEP